MGKKQRDDKKRAAARRAARQKAPKPSKVTWPVAAKLVKDYTDNELRAVAMHPVVTGLGCRPRVVSDEDWVVSAERVAVQEYADLTEFFVDFIRLLKSTAHLWVGYIENAKLGEYPPSRTSEKIPLPTSAFPGERGADARKWNAAMVEAVVFNPIYAGVPPFPPMIAMHRWAETIAVQVGNCGLRQALVNMLHALKITYGFPGGPAPLQPFGYNLGELPGEGGEEDAGEEWKDA